MPPQRLRVESFEAVVVERARRDSPEKLAKCENPNQIRHSAIRDYSASFLSRLPLELCASLARPAARAASPNSNCSSPATRGSSSRSPPVTGKSFGGRLAKPPRQFGGKAPRGL